MERELTDLANSGYTPLHSICDRPAQAAGRLKLEIDEALNDILQ